MGKYYSAVSGGFFDEALHGDFGSKKGRIPADAVAVTDEQHAALFADQAEGKAIVAGDGGVPVSVDPGPSTEQILAALRARRDRDLAASDWTQIGDNGLTAEARAAWAVYRQQLRDYIALVEAAIAAEEDPYDVPYPTPPAIAAPPAPPGAGDGGGGGRQDDVPLE